MAQTQREIEQAAAEAQAQFEETARHAREKAERDREIADQVQKLTATMSSPNQEVTVTVNHSGHIIDLKISQQGMALPASELSQLIMKSAYQAGAKVGQEVRSILHQTWGAGSSLAAHTTSAYDFFGDPPAAEIEQPHQTQTDSSWGGSVLRPSRGSW